MSKRTLIIKWSVIAALTVVLVFFASLYNTVFNTRNTNSDAVTELDTSADTYAPYDSDKDKKTLTVFPKEAPIKNTPFFNYVQNLGGSNKDEIVGSLCIDNYYYIISESNSTDHDFDSDSPKCLTVSLINDKGTLKKVIVISGNNPLLLDYAISRDGIIIIYKDSNVKFLKLSIELNRINEKEFAFVGDTTSANVKVFENGIYLFTSSGTSLSAYLLDKNFNTVKSKQTMYSGQLAITAVFTMSNTFKIFLNVESSRSFIKLLEFDFNLETMAVKDLSDEFSGNVISVTPFLNDTQHYAMLITSSGGTYLKIYDSDMQCTNMNYICKEKSVVLINFNNTLLVLGNKTSVCCCLHGDVILRQMPELNCFCSVIAYLIADDKICLLGLNDNREAIVVSYSSEHTITASINLGTATPYTIIQTNTSVAILLNAAFSENVYNINYGNTDGYIMEIKNEILQ